MKEIVKLFKRLCKDEGVFGASHRKMIQNFIKYMYQTGNCVFFGRTEYIKPYTEKEQLSFYKIQLELAVKLIEKDNLTARDWHFLVNDTLKRYVLAEEHYETDIDKLWRDVVKYSKKEEIEKIIIKYIPKKSSHY
jgi:hypothetical protein